MVIDLSAKYGLTEADWSRTLREAGVSLTQAQTKFPRYYSRWTTGEGKSAESFLDNGVFTSAYLDAFWTGHEHDIKNPPAGSGNIFISAGKWQTNQQLYLTFGRVFGEGVFLDKRYDTCVSPRHNKWNGDIKKRNVFVSPTYGREDLLGYHEGASFDNIRLDGAKTSDWYDSSYESSGIVGWDLGEGAEIGRIKADAFNDYGMELIRATPATVQYLSSFCNNLGAVGLTGTALGTINILTLSGDESPTLIDMREGHGRMAGGCLTVTAIKAETSTTPEDLIGPWKGQLIAKLRGQFNVVFTNIQYGSPWIKSGQLFWTDPKVNGVIQQSQLQASGKGFGFGAMLTDSARQTYYAPAADYSGWRMNYLPGEGPQGVLRINDVVQTPKSYPCDGPMGFARQGETLNYGTCTPMQKVGSTTPVPPVTPPVVPPVEPPIPPVEPPVTPPTGTLIASFNFNSGTSQSIVAQVGSAMVQNASGFRVSSIGGGRVVNTNKSATYPVQWNAVRKVVLKNVKVRATPADWYLMGNGQAGGFRGIVIKADGSVVENFNGDVTIAPAGTMSTTAKDVTLNLAQARDFRHWLAIEGAGNAPLFDADALEVWS